MAAQVLQPLLAVRMFHRTLITSFHLQGTGQNRKPGGYSGEDIYGRLEKYYKEYVLTEQAFVKDPDMTTFYALLQEG